MVRRADLETICFPGRSGNANRKRLICVLKLSQRPIRTMNPQDFIPANWSHPSAAMALVQGMEGVDAETVLKVVFHVSGQGDEGLETLTITRRELADYLGPGARGDIDDYFAAALAKYGPASSYAYDLMGRFLFEVVPYAETEDGFVEHGAFLVGKPWADHLPLAGKPRPRPLRH